MDKDKRDNQVFVVKKDYYNSLCKANGSQDRARVVLDLSIDGFKRMCNILKINGMNIIVDNVDNQ